MTSSPAPSSRPDAPVVRYYWRPGCPFCSRLRHQLDQNGVVTEDHNIWQDPEAAATVRLHARGNETVPTVVVGDGDDAIAMVNPSIAQVVGAIAALSA